MKGAFEVTFLVGGPGSGKTWVLNNTPDLRGVDVVGADHFIEADPRFENNGGSWTAPQLFPEACEWLEREWAARLEAGRSFVLDGTGHSPANMLDRFAQVWAAGGVVRVLYVAVPLPVALARNSRRARTLPCEVVRTKWYRVRGAVSVYRRTADRFDEVVNL